MTTRRGSQYSIQSDVTGIRGRIDTSKGKRKRKIPSGTESIQGSAISQRKVPEMPMISEPELELSMSNSNRHKLHSEGSNRHLHEPVKTVLHSVQRQGLGNVAPNTPRSDELLAHPQKTPQRGGNSEILQWMESTNIQTSNQKDQGIPCQKEGGNQGRSPNPTHFPKKGIRTRKITGENHIPKLQDSKNPKRCHGKCLQHGQNLDGIQGHGGTKNETTSFTKEINLSPDVSNTLTEIKNNILPLK
ncbi:hypothetical protein O181_117545 [Austropuccinia psidii MF-1]|uniref:Uncharacterized protein n=1 Tax=Austropuccinia psidii MF-1 TaxID=1389203 RepID=A0A9Q3KAJ6_9BASI|nr:hypothetical protein [Austropuccinia psidii MF-1]